MLHSRDDGLDRSYSNFPRDIVSQCRHPCITQRCTSDSPSPVVSSARIQMDSDVGNPSSGSDERPSNQRLSDVWRPSKIQNSHPGPTRTIRPCVVNSRTARTPVTVHRSKPAKLIRLPRLSSLLRWPIHATRPRGRENWPASIGGQSTIGPNGQPVIGQSAVPS